MVFPEQESKDTREIAKILGISRSYVSRIEKSNTEAGKRNESESIS